MNRYYRMDDLPFYQRFGIALKWGGGILIVPLFAVSQHMQWVGNAD